MAENTLHTLQIQPTCASAWPVPMRRNNRLYRGSESLGKLARNVNEFASPLPAPAQHLCGQVALDPDPYAALPGVPSPTPDT